MYKESINEASVVCVHMIVTIETCHAAALNMAVLKGE